ncbi:putative membrane protein [Nostocoides japonicum T1-X7]|uniref:Putative membrane protein n=1 Tax=Nostocoides japonicum T1-X7 TaxID=1194083 RepID=A0A077LUH8_9MICO|nr:PrsW family intramembrane metalloprotease [Tetrasphaera japonica]CCH77493.1 putative membrane protein [Tetrasphaera japonica T1-X7]
MTTPNPWTGDDRPQPPGVRTSWSGQVSAYDPGSEPGPGSQRRSSRARIRTWAITGLVVVGFAFSGLVLAVNVGGHLGLVTTLLAVLAAALPLGIVVPTFLWLDRFEAEPTRLLVFAFAWGALFAAAIAAFLNTSALAVFRAATDPTSALQTTAVVVAPFVEEAAKGLLVLVVWRFLRREFDGIIDGMVYAGLVAAGFAFTENITYLGQAYQEGGGPYLAATFVLRGVFSPFAHPIFTCMTGIGIGIAATSGSRWLRVVAPLAGYLLAVLAHSMWNLAATLGGHGMVVFYVLVEVPIFVAFLALIGWARRREGQLIGIFLSPYAAAGWLSPGEVAMLSSMSRRREARMWARTNTGPRGLAAMRAFQDAASELALLRRRMYNSIADAQALGTERQLLDALVARRREFIGTTLV